MVSRTTLRDLQHALDEAEQKLADQQAIVEQLRGVLAYLTTLTEDEETSSQPAKTVRNAMVDILKERGLPLHYRALYNELTQRGIEVNGKDPVRTVGAHLSNDSRFKSLGSGHWGLASWGDSAPGSTRPTAHVVTMPTRPVTQQSPLPARLHTALPREAEDPFADDSDSRTEAWSEVPFAESGDDQDQANVADVPF